MHALALETKARIKAMNAREDLMTYLPYTLTRLVRALDRLIERWQVGRNARRVRAFLDRND
jgi:hypothetical protein